MPLTIRNPNVGPRTKRARDDHETGKLVLDYWFGVEQNVRRREVADLIRRIDQGHGGTPTRKHWTRKARRLKNRRARAARRANRG